MIVNGHDQHRRYAVLPSVVAEGLAQGMTTDRSGDMKGRRGVFDDVKCLRAVDVAVRSFTALENIKPRAEIMKRKPQAVQRFDGFFI